MNAIFCGRFRVWLMLSTLCLALPAADPARRPAICFYDFGGTNNSQVTREILDAGFEVGRCAPGNDARWTLTWEKLCRFNVLVLVGLGNDFRPEHAALLDRFLEAGGGILLLPLGGNALDWGPSRDYVEKRLGLKIFIEQVHQAEKTVTFQAADGRIPYPVAWTDAITRTPVTDGVRCLWYPVERGSFYYNTAPLELSPEWQALVKTGPGAATTTKADGEFINSNKKEVDTFTPGKGRAGDFTLAAVRQVGNGRVAAVSLCPQLLFWGGYIPAFDSVLMKNGTEGRPSDWARLFLNLYRHLAEPSRASEVLGGHVTVAADVFTQQPGDPDIQFRDDLQFPPLPAKVRVGIAGARSALSTGRNSVADWSRAARQAGYDFLIFLDEMKRMDADKWLRLREECKQNSDDQFLAFPGIEFEAELGDRGFYLDDLGYWPDASVFTKDGRVRSSRGPADKWAKGTLNFREGMKLAPGLTSWSQLAMGHFAHTTNPTPFWNHNLYQILSVFSRDRGRVLDNWTIDPFLEVNAQQLHVAPFAVCLMNDATELPKPFQGGAAYLTFPGELKELHNHLSVLGNYAYNGSSSPVSVSDGPLIRQWAMVGSTGYVLPRWASGPLESDFYMTPNYRIRLRLAVAANAGLKEILIYDGQTLFRRFLPQGQPEVDLTLDVLNDNHSHFVAVVTDRNGRRAVTGELETENWLNRVYWCSDRCNFASAPHVHSAGVGSPVYGSTFGKERTVLNRWTFPMWGTDAGLVQGNVETQFCKGAYPDNGWVSYFDTSPITEYTWTNREHWWYQAHGRRFSAWEDYGLQGWDQIFVWPKPPSGNPPYYPYTEKEDLFQFREPVTFDGPQEWSIGPLINWNGQLDPKKPGEYELRLGTKRVAGVIPADGSSIDLKGALPSGSLIALRLNGDGPAAQTARAGTAIVYGDGLSYRLYSSGGRSILFQVGWQENGVSVKPGDTRRMHRFLVGNPYAGRAEHIVFYGKLEMEFNGPDAGFSSAQLDRLERGDWFTVTHGTLVNKLLPLEVKADNFGAALTVPAVVFPLNSLPIMVSGLNPDWTAYYCEPGDAVRRRPIAVSPDGEARVQFDRRKKNVNLWVGHPVVCSHREVRFDLIDLGDGQFLIEANNVSDRAVTATFRPGAECPFLRFAPFTAKLDAGGHTRLRTASTFIQEVVK